MKTGYLFILIFFLWNTYSLEAQDRLSLSGRLVKNDGSPEAGTHTVNVEVINTNTPGTILCSKNISLDLVYGMFTTSLEFDVSECGGKSFTRVLSELANGENLAYRISANGRTYDPYTIGVVPLTVFAYEAKDLAAPAGSTPAGYFLTWNGIYWEASQPLYKGTLTELVPGDGIDVAASGSDAFSVVVSNSGVTSEKVSDGSVLNSHVVAGANISRSKFAPGTPGQILVNDGSGALSSINFLPVTLGGLGGTSQTSALSALGIVRGVGAGQVLEQDSVPSCESDEKIQWRTTTPIGWSCVPDLNTPGDSTKLPLSGGELSGDMKMNGNRIVGLAFPNLSNEIATKSYVDLSFHWLESSGDVSFVGGRVGVGTISPEAILDISSLTSGFIYPRFSETQRDLISPVPKGSIIYNSSTNKLNFYDGASWIALEDSGSGLQSLTAGVGLSGGTLTTSGTIGLAPGGVSTSELADSAISDNHISSGASISRSKFLVGTPNRVILNNGSGILSEASALPSSLGGTGFATAAEVLTSLGLGGAATANIGSSVNNLIDPSTIPSCDSLEKLSMSEGPAYTWSCVSDADETNDTTKLPLAGGTMDGDINFDGNLLSGLSLPSSPSDLATKEYVDSHKFWTLNGTSLVRSSLVGIGAAPTESLNVTGNVALTGRLRLKSTTVSFFEWKAADAMTSNASMTLPSSAGNTNEVLTNAGSGSMSWSPLLTDVSFFDGDMSGSFSNVQLKSGVVSTLELANGSVTNLKVSDNAAIDRSKLASGGADKLIINNSSGNLTEVDTIPGNLGGMNFDSFSGGRLYISNSTGTGFEALVCSSGQYLSFNISGTPVCVLLPVAADGVAGIVSISAQKFSGLKKLEDGAVIGTAAPTCDSAFEGGMRYNSTLKKMEFCNGATWRSIANGTIASLFIGPPSVPLTKSGPVTFLITYGSQTDPATIDLSASNISFSGTDVSGCQVTSVIGSGLTRTVTVDNCSGTGTVEISIEAGTASSNTQDPALAGGPSTPFNVDNINPQSPTNGSLGTTPQNQTNTPVISYTPGTDIGSSVASHQVKIIRTSDGATIQDWADHESGTSLGPLTLSPLEEYSVIVRAVDEVENVSSELDAGSWTPPITTPSSLMLAHSNNYKTFTFSWTAGQGNGGAGGCRLQYLKDATTWTNLSGTYNCDANVTNASVTLPNDGWTNNFNLTGVEVRAVRVSDSSLMGTFSQKLKCTNSGSYSTYPTPSYDENCNGYWDDFTSYSVDNTYSGCPGGQICLQKYSYVNAAMCDGGHIGPVGGSYCGSGGQCFGDGTGTENGSGCTYTETSYYYNYY